MKGEGIEHTIVVFGSAKILSTEETRKYLGLVDKEDTEAYAKAIKKLEKSRYYEEVWEFGILREKKKYLMQFTTDSKS